MDIVFNQLSVAQNNIDEFKKKQDDASSTAQVAVDIFISSIPSDSPLAPTKGTPTLSAVELFSDPQVSIQLERVAQLKQALYDSQDQIDLVFSFFYLSFSILFYLLFTFFIIYYNKIGKSSTI